MLSDSSKQERTILSGSQMQKKEILNLTFAGAGTGGLVGRGSVKSQCSKTQSKFKILFMWKMTRYSSNLVRGATRTRLLLSGTQ